MQFTLALLSALAAATVVSAQGVTSILTPSAPAPSGCASTYSGTFEISVVLPSMKRDVDKRAACGGAGILVATLNGGVLHDALGRVGEIVANGQFQFDGPPAQAGSIYTGGWSVCSNGSLALGGSAVFYQCLSGTFYNLYDQSIGGQCQQVLIEVLPCGNVAQLSDGQPTGASATPLVTQISDGQVQATSAVMIPVSQYTDGQLQATAMATASPVAQISDGQIQASATSTAAPSTMATSLVPVSQISDGQIQASASTMTAPTTAAPTTAAPNTAANATTANPATTASFTGAAAMVTAGSQIIFGAAAFVALAML